MQYLLKNEEAECVALVDYLSILETQGKILLFTHVSNETYTTSWKQKHKNKRMGVRSGVPDYIIITPTTVLFLEMKRLKGGVVSTAQKEWLRACGGKKTISALCRGFDEAKKVIDEL